MTHALCTSFKVEMWRATHNFSASGGHQFKTALFTSLATLDSTTTAYGTSNEVVGPGYTAGGFNLTNVDSSAAGTTAMQTFSVNPSWTNATFTVSQALIYNATQSNRAVAVLDFGGSQLVSVGTFTISFPPVAATTALLRLL